MTSVPPPYGGEPSADESLAKRSKPNPAEQQMFSSSQRFHHGLSPASCGFDIARHPSHLPMTSAPPPSLKRGAEPSADESLAKRSKPNPAEQPMFRPFSDNRQLPPGNIQMNQPLNPSGAVPQYQQVQRRPPTNSVPQPLQAQTLEQQQPGSTQVINQQQQQQQQHMVNAARQTQLNTPTTVQHQPFQQQHLTPQQQQTLQRQQQMQQQHIQQQQMQIQHQQQQQRVVQQGGPVPTAQQQQQQQVTAKMPQMMPRTSSLPPPQTQPHSQYPQQYQMQPQPTQIQQQQQQQQQPQQQQQQQRMVSVPQVIAPKRPPTQPMPPNIRQPTQVGVGAKPTNPYNLTSQQINQLQQQQQHQQQQQQLLQKQQQQMMASRLQMPPSQYMPHPMGGQQQSQQGNNAANPTLMSQQSSPPSPSVPSPMVSLSAQATADNSYQALMQSRQVDQLQRSKYEKASNPDLSSAPMNASDMVRALSAFSAYKGSEPLLRQVDECGSLTKMVECLGAEMDRLKQRTHALILDYAEVVCQVSDAVPLYYRVPAALVKQQQQQQQQQNIKEESGLDEEGEEAVKLEGEDDEASDGEGSESKGMKIQSDKEYLTERRNGLELQVLLGLLVKKKLEVECQTLAKQRMPPQQQQQQQQHPSQQSTQQQQPQQQMGQMGRAPQQTYATQPHPVSQVAMHQQQQQQQHLQAQQQYHQHLQQQQWRSSGHLAPMPNQLHPDNQTSLNNSQMQGFSQRDGL